MKDYAVDSIRNVVLLGHGSSGKTSMGEALLYRSGATDRLGRVEEKNTVSDYDDEEKERGISVNTSVLPLEWEKVKLNVLDVPGYMDFIGEVEAAIKATDAGLVMVCAVSGVEVGTEVQWRSMDEGNPLPRMVFINKMDRDNASFQETLNQLQEKFDATFVPIMYPIGAANSFKGVVDLVEMKAYGENDASIELPEEMRDDLEAARIEMMEYAAEVNDELMLKYLDGEELSNEEILGALAEGISAGDLVPVLTGSATQAIGIVSTLTAMNRCFPSPAAVERTVYNMAEEQEERISCDPNAPLSVQVFKTMADPFVGKLSYFRVYSGTLVSDSRAYNANQDETERLGQLYMARGKDQEPVDQVSAGDIGVVTKLNYTETNDTLCDEGEPYRMPPVEYPEPLYSVAVFPSTKADLDKLGSSLRRLVEEDPTLRVERNRATNETILSGMGDSHIQIATRRLDSKFGVKVETDLPRIAYRETITKVASAQGRHKKQSGGRGQFGDVYCRFEPLDRGAGFEFEDEIFGGSVPKAFIPAVEKGIEEIRHEGILAGYPTVDFRCVLYDGSYHSVDSSEIAFKLAAHLAFRQAIPVAGPVLLEPIYEIVVTVPEEYMGDILGDLNTRRGRVLGMEQNRGNGVVTAEVPLAEIQRYATDLRSITQGRGIYRMRFLRYDIVPSHMVEQIQAEAERRREREAERS